MAELAEVPGFAISAFYLHTLYMSSDTCREIRKQKVPVRFICAVRCPLHSTI